MFERSDTRWAPWTVIDGSNKKAARIAALTAIADSLEKGVSMKPLPADPEILALAEEALGAPIGERAGEGD
jgi:AMP-polyphosphate phosphotransferase